VLALAKLQRKQPQSRQSRSFCSNAISVIFHPQSARYYSTSSGSLLVGLCALLLMLLLLLLLLLLLPRRISSKSCITIVCMYSILPRPTAIVCILPRSCSVSFSRRLHIRCGAVDVGDPIHSSAKYPLRASPVAWSFRAQWSQQRIAAVVVAAHVWARSISSSAGAGGGDGGGGRSGEVPAISQIAPP
jgi:hypothetical protein